MRVYRKNSVILIIIVLLLAISASTGGVSALEPDEYHELHHFEVEVEQTTNDSGRVTDVGFATFNFSVNATVKNDTFGFNYPVTLDVYEVDPDNPVDVDDIRANPSDYNRLGTTIVNLNPNNEEDYIPKVGVSGGRNITESFQGSYKFNGITTDSMVDRRIVVLANSTLTGDTSSSINNTKVKGPTAQGSSRGVAQDNIGYDSISNTRFVSDYKISESGEEDFHENQNLPSLDSRDFSGKVSNFADMMRRDGHAILESEGGSFDMVTRNKVSAKGNKEESTPYTLSIIYSLVDTEELNISILDSDGEEVKLSTEYKLTKDHDDSERCREISDEKNLCTFVLDSSETDVINRLGEVYVNYNISGSGKATIGCQAVITGYLETSSKTCGYGDAKSGLVLGIDSFEGETEVGGSFEWVSPVAHMSYDNMPRGLSTKLNVSTASGTGTDEYDAHYVIINKEEHIDGIDFTGNVHSGTIDLEDPDASIVEDTTSEVEWSELSKFYKAYVCLDSRCSSPSDINRANYDDKRDLIFAKGDSDRGFELRASDLTIILEDLEPAAGYTDSIKTKRTIDENYADGRDGWECRKGPTCPEDSPNPSFNGQLVETVKLSAVTNYNKVSKAERGEVIDDAADKRSDIGSYSWNVDNVEMRMIGLDQEFHGSSINIREPYDDSAYTWQSSAGDHERQVQKGYNEKAVRIVNLDSLRSSTGGAKGWYPIRPVEYDGDATSSFKETTYRRASAGYSHGELGIDNPDAGISPDNCNNCLPTENITELAVRKDYIETVNGWEDLDSDEKSNFYDKHVINTPSGVDIWELKNEEISYRNSRKNPRNFLPLDGTTSNSVFVDARDDTNNPVDGGNGTTSVIRNTDRSEKGLNLYETKTGIRPAKFRSPDTEVYDLYERERYDIEYTFRSEDITDEEIYVYEKEVREERNVYEGKIGWTDLSASEESGESINYIEVQYSGATAPITSEWDSDVFGQDPDGLNPSDIDNCDSFTRSTIEEDSRSGDGGIAVLDKCDYNNDGDSETVRIGKKYKMTGDYIPQVKGYGERGNTHSIEYTVQVRSRDDDSWDSPIFSEPEIEDVRAVNNKVDYNGGLVPIEIDLKAESERLNGFWELTVSPSDTIDEAASCSEISTSGGSYEQTSEMEISYEGSEGITGLQSIKCKNPSFIEPSEISEKRFILSTVEYIDGGATSSTTYNDIPKGAIQKCIGPLSGSADDCNGKNGFGSIDFGSPGNWKSVGAEEDSGPLGRDSCPSGYKHKTNEIEIDEGGSTATQHICEISETENPAEFTLKERSVSIRFESPGDVPAVDTCGDIPATSEYGEHDGYEKDSYENPDFDITEYRCVKIDPDDPGPRYVEDVTEFDDGDRVNPNALPPGAFRGNSITTAENTDICNEDTTDDGISVDFSGTKDLICTYGDADYDQVKYGELTVSPWSSTEEIVLDQAETSDAPKQIVQTNVLNREDTEDLSKDAQETFTTTINPRKTGLKPGKTHTFTIELLNGGVVETETVDVTLCGGQSVSSVEELPKNTVADEECTGFDNLLTGEPSIVNEQITVADAVGDGSGSEYTTIKNDACPYDARYPRSESDIKSAEFTVKTDNLATELRRSNKLSKTFYSSSGDPCENYNSDTRPPTANFVDEKLATIGFNKKSFAKNQKGNVDNIRLASLGDITKLDRDPSSTALTMDDRGSIRLGNPITRDVDNEVYETNNNLVAQYTFEDNKILSEDNPYKYEEGKDTLHGSTSGHVADPDFQKIQDVYAGKHDINGTSDYYVTIDDYTRYNARLWFTTPCDVKSDGERKNMGIADMRPIGTSPCPSGITTSTELKRSLSTYGRIEYSSDAGTSFDEKLYKNQTAFLPFDPSSQQIQESRVSSVIDTADDNPVNGEISSDVVRDSVADRFSSDGIRGGQSLRLDTSSWLMITSTCEEAYVESGYNSPIDDDFGFTWDDDALWVQDNIGTNGLTCIEKDPGDFDGFKGGKEYDSVNSNEFDLHDELSGENGGSYTISFWYKQDSELENNQRSKKPHRSLISATVPPRYNGGNIISDGNKPVTQSLALNYMKIMDIGVTGEPDGDETPAELINGEEPLDRSIDIENGYEWPLQSGENVGEFIFEGQIDDEKSDSGWAQMIIRYSSEEEAGSSENTLQIWQNGDLKSEITKTVADGDVVDGNQQSIEVGEIYDDGVLSIGGAFYQSEFDNKPIYNANPSVSSVDEGFYPNAGPFVSSSHGDVKVDEIKIFDDDIEDPVERLYNPKESSSEHNLDVNRPMYTGRLTTGVIEYGEFFYSPHKSGGKIRVDDSSGLSDENPTSRIGKEIRGKDQADCNSEECPFVEVSQQLEGASFLNIDVLARGNGTYKLHVIPCKGSNKESCVDSSKFTVSEIAPKDGTGLDGKSKRFKVPNNVDPIESFRFDISVGSDYIDESPVINNIKIQGIEAYKSCQDAQAQNPGLRGMSNINVTIYENYDLRTAKCDMRKANGGWTRFASLEEGDNIPKAVGQTVISSKSDCNLSEGKSCFRPANFDTVSSVNPSYYNNTSPADLRPQIMIKSKDENGNVIDWATYELNPYAHHKLFDTDDVLYGSEKPLNWVDDNRDTLVSYGPKDLVDVLDYGMDIVDQRNGVDEDSVRWKNPSEEDQEPIECLYPYSSSDGFNGGCITHFEHRKNGGDDKFEIEQLTFDDGADAWSPKFYHTRVQLEQSEDEKDIIDDLKCLQKPSSDKEVDKCELYYSTGNAFNNANVNINSDSQLVSFMRPTDRGDRDDDGTKEPGVYQDATDQPSNGNNKAFGKDGVFGIGVQVTPENVDSLGEFKLRGIHIKPAFDVDRSSDDQNRYVWVSVYRLNQGVVWNSDLDSSATHVTTVKTQTSNTNMQSITVDKSLPIDNNDQYVFVAGGSHRPLDNDELFEGGDTTLAVQTRADCDGLSNPLQYCAGKSPLQYDPSGINNFDSLQSYGKAIYSWSSSGNSVDVTSKLGYSEISSWDENTDVLSEIGKSSNSNFDVKSDLTKATSDVKHTPYIVPEFIYRST